MKTAAENMTSGLDTGALPDKTGAGTFTTGKPSLDATPDITAALNNTQSDPNLARKYCVLFWSIIRAWHKA